MNETQGRPPTRTLVLQSLRGWSARHVVAALTSAVVVGVLIGVSTVLIPNPLFGREIAPVGWNYPVWLLTAVLSGMLLATYVRVGANPGRGAGPGVAEDADAPDPDPTARRSSRLGLAGGILAWFAVGCPVCNKLALLALGYSGAISYFAPVQPFLAVAALLLTAVALTIRLRNQALCPTPRRTVVPT